MFKGKISFDASRLKLNAAALEGLFKPKSPPLIGADVSSSAVKMVELTNSGPNRYRVERYAIESLPKDSVVDGNINNLDAVCDALSAATSAWAQTSRILPWRCRTRPSSVKK